MTTPPNDHGQPPTQPITPSGPGLTAKYMVALAVLAAIAPLATDLYLSTFPTMVDELNTVESSVQLTLTTFLIGTGVGQLILGPLSDRMGRMAPLRWGLALSVVASLVAVFAPSIWVLIIARFLQGTGASAGMVIGRAIVTDVTSGKDAARGMNMIMMIGGIAPVAAPVVGSLLAAPLGWRGLLGLVAVLCVLALALSLMWLRETLHARDEKRSRQPGSLRPLATRSYLGYTLTFAFAFAAMMAYISASPFLFQDMIGLSTIQYGFAFGLNALLILASTAYSSLLTRTMSVRRIAGIGLTAVTVAVAVLLVMSLTMEPSLWFAVPILFAVAPMGFIFGNATALSLSRLGAATGAGSAGLGFLQFTLAGIVAPLVSLDESSPVPLAMIMLVSIVIAWTGYLVARPRAGQGPID